MEKFIQACRDVLDEFYGQNIQKSNSYGRIINHRQFDRLKGMLDKCDPKTIVIGGQTDREDLFIAPTLVCPVNPDDPNLMQQEIFGKFTGRLFLHRLTSFFLSLGPILPIVPIKDVDEGIQIVNSRDYPLALYIFTSDKKEYNYSKYATIS